MAGLQTIIDNCDSLEIDRRKVVGIQITRNEIPRTSVTPTYQPWRMKLTMPARFQYSQVRDLLEALDTLDRNTPQVVTFANNSALSWIFRYQGAMSAGNISAILVQSFVGNQLVLSGLPAVPSGTVLFEPNDLIQIGTYPFPFTSTGRVLRGSGSTVIVYTNRPNIISTPITPNVLGITVGNPCQFKLFCPNMPTYKLYPGGYLQNSAGTTINNALIEFSDAFTLYEYVGDA